MSGILPQSIKETNPKRSPLPRCPWCAQPHGHPRLAIPWQCSAQLMSRWVRAPAHTEPKVRTEKCSLSCQGSTAPCSLGILATAPQREDVLQLKEQLGNRHRGVPSHRATSPRSSVQLVPLFSANSKQQSRNVEYKLCSSYFAFQNALELTCNLIFNLKCFSHSLGRRGYSALYFNVCFSTLCKPNKVVLQVIGVK